MERTYRPVVVRITPLFSTVRAIFQGQNRRLTKNGFDVHVITSSDPIAQAVAREEGFTYHPVCISRKITPYGDLRALKWIVGILKDIRPDIVHTHTSKGGLLGILAARMVGVKARVHSVAGWSLDMRTGFSRAVLSVCEQITISSSTHILANSVSLLDTLVKRGYLTYEKGCVLGRGSSNGVDLGRFSRNERNIAKGVEIRKQYGINNEDVVVAFVGRIMEEKGIVETVEAFSKLSNQRTRLLLIGSVEETSRKGLKTDIINRIHEHPRIHLTGWRDDIVPYLSASDILIHPSHHEGLPNAILQGAAMELPCVAADVRGSRDAVLHGSTGFLIPPRSVDALQSKLSLLIENSKLRATLGSNGRKFVEEHFDQEVVSTLLINYYNEILRMNGGPKKNV